MENKKNNNGVFISIICILVVIVLGLGGYLFLEKNNSNSNNGSTSKNSQNSVSNKVYTDGLKRDLVVPFDSSKAINSKGETYTLGAQGSASFWATVDSTQKVLTVSFVPAIVVENYPLNWTSTRRDMTKSTITFNKKIAEIFFGGFGQSMSGDTLFILLEDGTLEYIPLVHALNNTQAELVSYGEIKGVNGVVKLSLANTSGGVTTLAMKNDGSFYDLYESLKNSGNY